MTGLPPEPPGPGQRCRGEAALWLTLLILAAGLRLAWLDQPSFWEDEIVTVQNLYAEPWPARWDHPVDHGFMRSQPLAASWVEYTANIWRHEDSPLGYFWLVRAWSLLAGVSEAGLRSLSALLGVAAVLLFFGLARRLFPPRAALAAGTLFAVHPFLVEIAREARPYSLLLCLAVASLWLLLRIGDGRARTGERLLFVAVTAALLYTHYFAVCFVAGEALVLLAVWRRPACLWLFGAAGLLFWPGGLAMIQRAGAIQSGERGIWVKAASWSLFDWLRAGLALPKKLLLGSVFVPDAWLGRAALLLLGLALAAMLVAGWRAWFRRDRRQALTMAILLTAPVLLTMILDTSLKLYTVQTPRYLSFLALPYLLLLAAAFIASSSGWATCGRLLPLALLLALANLGYLSEGKHGFDWRTHVRQAEAFAGPSGVILTEYYRDPLLVGWYLADPHRVVPGHCQPLLDNAAQLLPGTKLAFFTSIRPAGSEGLGRHGRHRLTPLVKAGLLQPLGLATVPSRYKTVLYFRRTPSPGSSE